MDVEERDLELDGQPVHLRVAGALSGPGDPPEMPTVYVHGLPGDGGDWAGLLGRTGGLAPDLLGFGRSGKGGHLEYTPAALARFLARLLDELQVARFRLAAHGSGAAVARELIGLRADAVDRVVLFSPLVPERAARWLRRAVIGELLMGSATAGMMRRWYRRGAGGAEAFTAARVEEVWRNFDQGTQRAILRLLRGAPDEAAGRDFDIQALVIEGELDPWRAAGGGGGAAIPGERATFPTGHWPWLHAPATDRAAAFLAGGG